MIHHDENSVRAKLELAKNAKLEATKRKLQEGYQEFDNGMHPAIDIGLVSLLLVMPLNTFLVPITILHYFCDYVMNHDPKFSTLHQCSKEAENHSNGGSTKFTKAREPEFPT